MEQFNQQSSYVNVGQATQSITLRARRLVCQLIEKRGHDRPPFLVQEYAPLKGIKQIVEADLGRTSAYLFRSNIGHIIKVNKDHGFAKQNFSCAHEIGHLLFDELKLQPFIQSIEYRGFNPQRENQARAAAIERLCDAAATELLMPESVFKKYLSVFGVSISSIERLSNVFKTSLQATTIRVVELSVEPYLALLWQPWPRSKPSALRLAWCLGQSKKSGRKSEYIPRQIIVRRDSGLFKAYESKNVVKSFKDFKQGNIPKRLPLESKGFGYGETRYVISLASINR